MLRSYDVVHVRVYGQNLIIVPLSPLFEFIGISGKCAALALFNSGMRRAGLAGEVVLVWPDDFGYGMYGPGYWLPFVKLFSLEEIYDMVNRQVWFDLTQPLVTT